MSRKVGVTRGGLREVVSHEVGVMQGGCHTRWVSCKVSVTQGECHARWVSCEVGVMRGGLREVGVM